MNVQPTNIYWGYMGLRAAKLALPFDTPEDLASAVQVAFSLAESSLQDFELRLIYAYAQRSRGMLWVWPALGSSVDSAVEDMVLVRLACLLALQACFMVAEQNPSAAHA